MLYEKTISGLSKRKYKMYDMSDMTCELLEAKRYLINKYVYILMKQ